ncbi:MAG: hypothetical protein ACYSXF_10115 [Planctomycetota bacterium]
MFPLISKLLKAMNMGLPTVATGSAARWLRNHLLWEDSFQKLDELFALRRADPVVAGGA